MSFFNDLITFITNIGFKFILMCIVCLGIRVVFGLFVAKMSGRGEARCIIREKTLFFVIITSGTVFALVFMILFLWNYMMTKGTFILEEFFLINWWSIFIRSFSLSGMSVVVSTVIGCFGKFSLYIERKKYRK